MTSLMDDMVEIMELADEILSSGRGGDYEVTIVYRQDHGSKTETQAFRGVRLDEIPSLAPISDGCLIDSLSAENYRYSASRHASQQQGTITTLHLRHITLIHI